MFAPISIYLAAALIAWELFNYFAWIYSINHANDWNSLNQAAAGTLLGSLLGFFPALGVVEAGAVKWFGLFFGAMLTNPFDIFTRKDF